MATFVLVRLSERTARRGQGQVALAHALEREQLVGKLPQLAGRPAQNQHFQALVPVEVDVSGGDDLGKGIMLHLHQTPCQFRLVVSVDIRKYAHG